MLSSSSSSGRVPSAQIGDVSGMMRPCRMSSTYAQISSGVPGMSAAPQRPCRNRPSLWSRARRRSLGRRLGVGLPGDRVPERMPTAFALAGGIPTAAFAGRTLLGVPADRFLGRGDHVGIHAAAGDLPVERGRERVSSILGYGRAVQQVELVPCVLQCQDRLPCLCHLLRVLWVPGDRRVATAIENVDGCHLHTSLNCRAGRLLISWGVRAFGFLPRFRLLFVPTWTRTFPSGEST